MVVLRSRSAILTANATGAGNIGVSGDKRIEREPTRKVDGKLGATVATGGMATRATETAAEPLLSGKKTNGAGPSRVAYVAAVELAARPDKRNPSRCAGDWAPRP